MSNLKMPNMHYLALDRTIGVLPHGKKLCYETRARKLGNVVDIVHHKTVIARIGAFSVVVRNGGHHSVTTANRLNKVLRDNGIPYFVGINKGRMTLRGEDRKPLHAFRTLEFTMIAGLWELTGMEQD